MTERRGLRGKVVVITGASRGLGRAVAEQAAARGATVVLAARGAADLDACAHAIVAAGGRASACPTDVTSLEAMQALRDHALREHGRLDAWVNDPLVFVPRDEARRRLALYRGVS